MSETGKKNNEQYYFVSYCRQEVTFVDLFYRELEKRGLRTWVDFKNLIPGTPWQEQLDNGVKGTDTVLLIVSNESMKSGAVKDEWTKAIDWGKRIILISFEPCKLPAPLEGLEWENFTGNFDKAMDALMRRLSKTREEMRELDQQRKASPPRMGKYLPLEVRWVVGLNVLTFFLSLISVFLTFQVFQDFAITDQLTFNQQIQITFSFCVVFAWLSAMWQLIRFNWHIFIRKHNMEKYRNALNWIIVTHLLGAVAYSVNGASGIDILLIPAALCLVLHFILRSKGVYRWAGPTGVILRFNKPDVSSHSNNLPLTVGIESAPQDRKYAEEFSAALAKAGHKVTENLEEAKVILTLLSVFKTDSAFDPEDKVIFPVLLQSCKVAERLSKMQWVDLRNGRAAMDGVANLLDEPEELMRILGVLPVRNTIYPAPVRLALGIFPIPAVVFAIMLFLSFPRWDSLVVLISWAAIFILRDYLANRRAKYLPFLSYEIATGLMGLVTISSTVLLISWSLGILGYAGIALLWLVLVLFFVKDVRIWLPARVINPR